MAQASMERKATRVAVIVAVVLLFTKLLAYRLTGSTAVFGDAMESLTIALKLRFFLPLLGSLGQRGLAGKRFRLLVRGSCF